MRDITIDIFHKLFFPSNTNAESTNPLINENNILQSSTIRNIQNRLLKQLADWTLFIETKAQGNITISLFVLNNFLLFIFSFIFSNLVVNINFLVLYILHLLIVHVVVYVHQYYLLMNTNII